MRHRQFPFLSPSVLCGETMGCIFLFKSLTVTPQLCPLSVRSFVSWLLVCIMTHLPTSLAVKIRNVFKLFRLTSSAGSPLSVIRRHTMNRLRLELRCLPFIQPVAPRNAGPSSPLKGRLSCSCRPSVLRLPRIYKRENEKHVQKTGTGQIETKRGQR